MVRFEVVDGEKVVKLPVYATEGSAGADFYCNEDVTIEPGQVKCIMTGVKARLMNGFALLLMLRSSLSMKGLMLANGVGLVDSDYYNNESNGGNIGFIIRNMSDSPFTFKKGDRLGQGVVVAYVKDNYAEVLSTERSGGFGCTGV